MFEKLHGVVLYASKYPRGYVVHCYTREHGRMAMVVNGAGHKGNVRKVLFQPLSQVELEVRGEGKGLLPRVVEGHLAFVYETLPYDFKKNAVALFLAEFLAAVLKDEQGDKALFDFVESSLRRFDGESEGVANFHLAFLVNLLSFMGIAPNMKGKGLPFFDLIDGVYCDVPHHEATLEGVRLQKFEVLMGLDYENMATCSLRGVERGELVDLLVRYYEVHLQLQLRLRSLEVMRSLFS